MHCIKTLIIIFVAAGYILFLPTAFAKVSVTSEKPTLTIIETFHASEDHETPTLLDVDVSYDGARASSFKTEADKLHLANNLFYDYSNCYNDLKIAQPFFMYDIPDGQSRSAFGIDASYEIDNLWEKTQQNLTKKAFRACFYNQNIKDELSPIRRAARAHLKAKKTEDLALPYPFLFTKQLHIIAPENAKIALPDAADTTIRNAYFTFVRTTSLSKKTLAHAYRFEIHKASVPASDIAKLLADLKEVDALSATCDVRYSQPLTRVDYFEHFFLALPAFVLALLALHYFWRRIPSHVMASTAIQDYAHTFTLNAPIQKVWDTLIRFETIPYTVRIMRLDAHNDEHPWKPEDAVSNTRFVGYYRHMMGLLKTRFINEIVTAEAPTLLVTAIPRQAVFDSVPDYEMSARETITLHQASESVTRVCITCTTSYFATARQAPSPQRLARIVAKLYRAYEKLLRRALAT